MRENAQSEQSTKDPHSDSRRWRRPALRRRRMKRRMRRPLKLTSGQHSEGLLELRFQMRVLTRRKSAASLR